MHLAAHSLSAMPFLACGFPEAALGAIAPDLTWIHMETKFRLSGKKNWREWAEESVTPLLVMPYKIAHSFLIVFPCCILFEAYEFLMGWTIHVLMDLPTHGGIMTQQPLYPIKWKWKWIMPSYY